MDITNINEDDDVVIKGSTLYEHLHKLGYNDFETITIEQLTTKNERKFSKLYGFLHSIRNSFKKLGTLYLKIIQDDALSKKHVETILDAKILLRDHSCHIYNFLDKYDCKLWWNMVPKFILFGTVVLTSIYMSYNTQYKNTAHLFTLTVLSSAAYIQYMREHAHRNLKCTVSLQNDLFDLCKKGMKILQYEYKIRLNKGRNSEPFSDLAAGRVKYLPPIMENLVKYLEHISRTYYQASLVLINLLPINFHNDDLLTRFEDASFEIHGEVDYQKLKTLYHTYILTQSEMLHLLAIAYDNHIWRESYKKIPELKLSHIIYLIIICLTKHKNKLSDVIDAYYKFKLLPMSYKFEGSDSSQWKDLYLHLYFACNKLELAYSHVISVLRDIDNDAIENVTGEYSIENPMERLNAAQKSIENAKDFVELGSLFLAKTQVNCCTDYRLETNIPKVVVNTNMQIVTDAEPEILDEVFEEYITKEYLKPSSEEADEVSLYNYKRDKILFKNFMAELKDALVDKQKSMSEREAKALQRIYKTLIKENTPKDNHQRIPTPPPMPLFNVSSLIQGDNRTYNDTRELQVNQLPAELNITKSIKNDRTYKQVDFTDISMEKAPIATISLPPNKNFSSVLLPSFLNAEEETFVGRGENSEDEEAKTE